MKVMKSAQFTTKGLGLVTDQRTRQLISRGINVKSGSGARRNNQVGLTLVELMIAMLIGLFISAGVMSLFLAGKRGYSQDEQMAGMQENSRFALRMLARDIALAGYMGGWVDADVPDATGVTVTADCSPSPWALDADRPLEFADDVAASYSDQCVSNALNDAATGAVSDVLTVRRSSDEFSFNIEAFPGTGLNPASSSFGSTSNAQRMFLLQDSSGTDATSSFVYGSSVGGAAGYIAKSKGFQVSEYLVKTFYIRNFSSVAGDNVPCLAVSYLNASHAMTADCYVEGVQAMQFLFGIDNDGDRHPDLFVESPTGAQLQQVTSIKLSLLMRSVGEVPQHLDAKTYTVGTKTVGPFNDRFYRRVYSATVRLPNIIRLGG